MAIVVLLLVPTGTRIVSLDLETIFADYSHTAATAWGGIPAIDVDSHDRKVRVQCLILPKRSWARSSWAQDKSNLNRKGQRPSTPLGDDAFFNDGMIGPSPELRVLRTNLVFQVFRVPHTPHAPTDALDRLELEEVAQHMDSKLAHHSAGVHTQFCL